MSGAYRPFDGDAWLGRELPLAGGPYTVAPETAFAVAEEMAYARQGRKARVFQVIDPAGQPYALKTFYRGFSLPAYAAITEALRPFGDVPGLRSCQRRVIGAEEAEAAGEPGLTWAVLMPWIEGVSWAGVVEGRHPLAERTCLAFAAQTATVLAGLEERGLVHADISSSNVLLVHAESGPAVELIDVEDMYHESFQSLPYVPDGSPGYAHPRNQGRGCRNRYGDRFAGAVLLTEMLVWHDQAVRESSADVSVFDQRELGRSGPRYDLVRKVLATHSPTVAGLFERVWDSTGPSSCPRLADWAAAMATVGPDEGPRPDTPQSTVPVADCPGCGRPVLPGQSSADHAPTCPLRAPTGPVARPDKSAYPGVPRYDDIGFVPLFDG